MKANILFWNELSEETKQLVNTVTGTYFQGIENGELTIHVKEVTKEKQTTEFIRTLAGNVSRTLQKNKMDTVSLNEEALVDTFTAVEKNAAISAFVEGWHLGAYDFDKYKSKKANATTQIQFTNEKAIEHVIAEGEIRAAATAFSRDLMNETSTTLNPETFPEILQEAYANTAIEVVVHDKSALESMEMNGLLAVNRGSKYDPAFIELHYKGDETKPLIALVGKGVTFDTGGISLKSGRNISDMRMDMGGAAAVAGALKLLAESGAKVNVVGLIQTVENIPDRHSILPGEIITYKNGHTVQVGNTDAEGRLILADGLIRAGELGAKYTVDIATLTGAIGMALGPKLGGIFGNDEAMEEMKQVGDVNGDRVWPMPLVDAYDETLHSDYADFCNISTQASGGSITAALFLRRFVAEETTWVHVDMAGVMDSKATGYLSAGGTGFGARLLADYAVKVSN